MIENLLIGMVLGAAIAGIGFAVFVVRMASWWRRER